MGSSGDAEAWARLDAAVAAVSSADHPYHAAGSVQGLALDLIDADVGAELYLLWAELQDWYELREEDQAEALHALREAAAQWPAVKDDRGARGEYFALWRATIRTASERPRRPAEPDVPLGSLQGQVEDYDLSAGIGFIRAGIGGPTFVFRWDEIKTDAFLKTLDVGARVSFEGYESHAGERYARAVVPST
jgi:cold shock CspA family protein